MKIINTEKDNYEIHLIDIESNELYNAVLDSIYQTYNHWINFGRK